MPDPSPDQGMSRGEALLKVTLILESEPHGNYPTLIQKIADAIQAAFAEGRKKGLKECLIQWNKMERFKEFDIWLSVAANPPSTKEIAK